MVLSKREKYIAIITAAIILLFALDHYVWSPVMDSRAQVQTQKKGLEREMQQAERILKKRERLASRWDEMKEGGLGSDPSAIESRVLNAIQQWSNSCGLPISTVKPDRDKGDGQLRQIMFNLALTGDMASVGQFLWEVENCSLPLRITEFQLGSRGGDASDLSLQLKLSALYLAEDPEGEPLTEVN
jgi:Tfp pilus assembly protein PilO